MTQQPMTRLVRTGRSRALNGPFVNPPVIHASTVLFDTAEVMASGEQRYVYGRRGTPTSEALETAVSDIEGAAGAVVCPSGLSAVSTALLSVLASGDHLLMADNVYDPARHIAESVLTRMGIETEFFDPTIGAAIAGLIRPNTSAIYIETPGSLTFEMTDVPAVVAAARAHGAVVLADNTWATPYFFKPLDFGVDLSIHAATKYMSGHSDVMIGTVAANDRCWKRLKETHGTLGLWVGPDDVYLALRGLRTMGLRLDRQMQSGLTVARWLAGRPEVSRVLHPALETDPGHAIWRRDMGGAAGLFSFVPKGWSTDQARAFLNALSLFGLGFSWGGFESLAVIGKAHRTATKWPATDILIRLNIGLEDPDDLIADLAAAFAAVSGLS